MKKLTYYLFAALMTFFGANVYAQEVPEGETDVTTLEWVNKGQDCVNDFNNENGGTVFGTDAGGSSLSYVDVSAYGIIKLYGTANQTARLFINRAEFGDNGIFFVEIGEDGIGVFDCNKILEKQPKAQYIHLNGVKASAWNTQLNLSMITVSGSPIEFPEIFILPEGEIDITTLDWVNEGQDCVNNLGVETDAPIYGTHDGANDGKLSYVDITNYATIKLYGHAGDVVRLFINRAEFEDFQFNVTIGEDGVGAFNLADIYAKQAGAEYIHLNGVKTAATWQGSPTGKAKVDYISLIEKPFTLPEGEIDITTLTFVGNIEANNIGKEIAGAAVIYGDQNNGDNFHVDVTEYKEVKIYGTTGALVRVFVNREGTGDVHEQKVAIGENGIGVLDIETVMTTLGTDKVWINCFKNAAGWQGGTDDPVTFKAISVTKKDISTSINTVNTTTSDNAYYTLQGVKVAVPSKGIFIHNGRKVVVK